jgi:hypothetical protein
MTYQRKRAGAKAITALLGLLTTAGGDYAALCKASGLSQPVISAWIRELRRAKLAFIGNWANDSRGIPTIPVFHWGPFPDMPRPPGKPAKQRVAEWRARQGARK